MKLRLRNLWQLLLLLCGLFSFAIGSAQAPQKPKPRTYPCRQTPCVSRSSQTVVDSKIPDDAALERMLKPYAGKVRALNVVIGKLESELRKGGVGRGLSLAARCRWPLPTAAACARTLSLLENSGPAISSN
jgi:hypothetical protein